jgi:hypothetical protein
LFPACHKTSPAGSGFVGSWRLARITGGPFIDVVGVSRDQISIMRLQSDSSWANFYNFRAAGKGYWSVRPNPAGNSPHLFVSTDSLGVAIGGFFSTQYAWLSGDKLILKNVNDTTLESIYIRTRL